MRKDKLDKVLYAIVLFALAIIIALFASCKSTQTVVVDKTAKDSVYITNWNTDSIYIHDSIFVHHKADTVYRDRWHTEYRYKELHDTLMVTRVDSIPYVQEVIVPERYVPDFYKNCTCGFWIIIVAFVLWLALKIYKRIKGF